MPEYIHGVRADIVLEQRRLDAEQELARLARGEPLEPAPLVHVDPPARKVLDDEAALQLISMTFRSRKGNTQPHIVTLRPVDGSLQCTCEASHECWAKKGFRAVKGMFEV